MLHQGIREEQLTTDDLNTSIHLNEEFNSNSHPNEELNSCNLSDEEFNTSSHTDKEIDFHTLQLLSSSRQSNDATNILKNDLVSNIEQCLMCKNGDLPTGIHRCQICKKALHLFGCSVPAENTEEGCGEMRIGLQCNKRNIAVEVENKSVENWRGQGLVNILNSKNRSAKSYLNKQPDFEYVNFNYKGPIKAIMHLKNGSTIQHKPILLPRIGKLLLSNTCSADSILTVLACSAADSNCYKNIFISAKEINKTAAFIMKMINQNCNKNTYKERAILLLEHFENDVQMLVGGLKQVDVMDTIKNITEKLLNIFPSYAQVNKCSNALCDNLSIKTNSIVLSLNALGGEINIEEVIKFFLPTSEICNSSNCGQIRNSVLSPLNHVLIELVSIPKGNLLFIFAIHYFCFIYFFMF